MKGNSIRYTFWSWSRDSASLGAKTGCVLSLLYMILFIGIGIVVGLVTGGFRENPVGTVLASILVIAIAGSIIGVIPSIVVGTITALCISTPLWFIKKWLSVFLAIIIGVGVCFGFTTLAEYAVWSRIIDKATGIGMAYYSWRGWPTIVYVVAGGYIGWRLFKILSDKTKSRYGFPQPDDAENHGDAVQS